MDAIKYLSKKIITRNHVFIIQEFINLAHITVYGLNVGVVAKESGKARDAKKVHIMEFYYKKELCYA
jgi:hypothetical protein